MDEGGVLGGGGKLALLPSLHQLEGLQWVLTAADFGGFLNFAESVWKQLLFSFT